jgi:hypothetical protein
MEVKIDDGQSIGIDVLLIGKDYHKIDRRTK